MLLLFFIYTELKKKFKGKQFKREFGISMELIKSKTMKIGFGMINRLN